MSAIAEFNVHANDATDREHQVQLELLQKLCQAIDTGLNASTVNELLGELISYSEVHFMSEELLMRMKSYDDYEEHQEDHFRMLDALRDIAANNVAGRSALMAGKAHEVLGFINQHIATRDKRLADYVRHNL
jgi:hemerythrin